MDKNNLSFITYTLPVMDSALIINVYYTENVLVRETNLHTHRHTPSLKGYLKVIHSPFSRLAK